MPVRVWLLAAVFVCLAWATGYPLWAQGDPVGFYRGSFDLLEPSIVGLVGLPLSIAAGLLTASSERKKLFVGYLVLAANATVLGYLGSFSFFGGVCLDPGEDVCITPWSSRLAVLLAALVALGVGFAVGALHHRRVAGAAAPARV